MTLSNTVVRVQYNGDNTTASFTVTFPFWDADDLTVILTDANGDDTTWVRGTQYTVSGGDGATGTVSVETTPTDYTPASGETLTILSALTLTQDVSLPLGGALPSADVEQRLDKTVRLIQQMDEKLDRAVLLPESSSNTDLTIPDPVADNLLRWKDDLSGLENVAASSATILSQLNDSDNDTIINVEESADEDIVRVDIAGTQKGRWDATGLVLGTLNTAPDGDLHIFASSAGTISAHADADNLVIESSANTGLTILSGTTGLGSLHFGDSGDNDIGKITYDHSDNTMRVYVNATLEGRWDATGLNIAGNDVAPDGPLHIGAGLAGSVTANANGDGVILEDSGNTGYSILVPDDGSIGHFIIGSPANNQAARMQYRPSIGTFYMLSGGEEFLRATTSGVVINENGFDHNFRIEGDTEPNLFFLDAGKENIGLGSASPDASALLDMVSTTKGLGLPSMTTTQRDNISTPRDGLIGHNSTTNTVDARLNGAWVGLASDVSVGLVLLATASASNDATVDFTSNIDSTYEEYVLVGRDIVPATDDVEIYLQMAVSGTFQTGSTDYSYGGFIQGGNSAISSRGSNGSPNIAIVSNGTSGDAANNGTGEGVDFGVHIYNPANSSLNTRASGFSGWQDDGNRAWCRSFSGVLLGTGQAVDGLRVLAESGNITSGEFALYGVKTS